MPRAFPINNAISGVSARFPFMTSFRLDFCMPVSLDNSLCFMLRAASCLKWHRLIKTILSHNDVIFLIILFP